jgi:hypothetical protein
MDNTTDKITSANGLYRKCIASGRDPRGAYTAHCGETHDMVGLLRQNRWHTGKIKGLRRACWNAKVTAVLLDLYTKGSETGVSFWVEEAD